MWSNWPSSESTYEVHAINSLLSFITRHILAGYKSGDVKFLNCDNHKMMRTEWRVGPSLDSMKVKKHLMATGGEENQLKLWDLNSTKLIYHAKNVSERYVVLIKFGETVIL